MVRERLALCNPFRMKSPRSYATVPKTLSIPTFAASPVEVGNGSNSGWYHKLLLTAGVLCLLAYNADSVLELFQPKRRMSSITQHYPPIKPTPAGPRGPRGPADVIVMEPVEMEPVEMEPVAVEPIAVEPVEVEPIAVELIAVEPVEVEPIAVELIAVEPVAVEPIAVALAEEFIAVALAEEFIAVEPAAVEPTSPASSIEDWHYVAQKDLLPDLTNLQSHL
jgi:hypothetical protein